MAPKIGYLLPTRERIMEGQHETGPLLTLAEQAEALGYDSIWVGDSLLARPRHEPITLLAGVAGRTRRVKLGTAVLLPHLRNPVVLAHMVTTLDQVSDGRVILGCGIAGDVPNIRAEFESAGVPFDKRVGRMMEGLRLMKALWSGEPVDWDGRWKVEQGVLGPEPVQKGGPPLWGGGSAPAGLARAGRFFDGWFPTGPDAEGWARDWAEVRRYADEAGRGKDEVTGAVYLTLALDDDRDRADEKINGFLKAYYGARPDVLRKRQACYAGPAAEVGAYLKSYVDAGASHLCVRFAGDHEANMETIAKVRADLGW